MSPRMFVSCDLQDVHQHQGQRHEGSQQGQREQEKAGIEPAPALDGGMGLRHQPGLPQGGDHRLVDQQDQRHVQAALHQVEGQEHRDQHGDHDFLAIHLHIDGRDEIVPQQHHHREANSAQSQADDGALAGVELLVDEGGGAAEGAGGQHIHDAADGAGVADGEHLHHGHHDGDDGGGQGAVDKAADADDGVLQIHLEEVLHLRQHLAEEHHHIGEGSQHGHGGQRPHVRPGADRGLEDIDIGFRHKNTLLYQFFIIKLYNK